LKGNERTLARTKEGQIWLLPPRGKEEWGVFERKNHTTNVKKREKRGKKHGLSGRKRGVSTGETPSDHYFLKTRATSTLSRGKKMCEVICRTNRTIVKSEAKERDQGRK